MSMKLQHTDPTYKEWKLFWVCLVFTIKKAHGSYLQGMETRYETLYIGQVDDNTDPTYKEWKRGYTNMRMLPLSAHTDPTYKEWKLNNTIFRGFDVNWTRILPTRNGNRRRLASPWWGLRSTRILPTRNGNYSSLSLPCSQPSHGSYLQGMETSSQSHCPSS